MTPDLIDELASRQLALITHPQLVTLGLSEARIRGLRRSGQLLTAQEGVYRCRGAPRSWHQEVLASVMAAGADAVASHQTALALHGVVAREPRPIEVLVPWTTESIVTGAVVHRTRRLTKHDVEWAGPIPMTDGIRSLLDAAPGFSPARVGWTLDRLLVVSDQSAAQLLIQLERIAAGRRRAGLLRSLLRDRLNEPADIESWGQQWLLRLLRDRGFPDPVCEHRIRDERGLYVARADLAYPHVKLDLEYDGKPGHGHPVQRRRDRERDARLEALGWLVLRAHKGTRHQPGTFLAAVAARLATGCA